MPEKQALRRICNNLGEAQLGAKPRCTKRFAFVAGASSQAPEYGMRMGRMTIRMEYGGAWEIDHDTDAKR